LGASGVPRRAKIRSVRMRPAQIAVHPHIF
jgi:hypothetical protein